jgi:antibiotic biosynthesis monooxygenase (ABM) superfamily enzyme
MMTQDPHPQAAHTGPVTVSYGRRIRLDREAAFEAWLREVSTALAENPGYLGATILRPPPGSPSRDFVTILRFASFADQRHWETSARRAELLARSRAMDETDIDERHDEGMEYWFTPAGPAAPARWKMVLLLGLTISVLSQILLHLVDPLLPGVPTIVLQIAGVFIQVALITYLIMSRLTRILRFWLFPTH